MKLVSFYLPQFHEIPENNDAWGSGFTEWVNVKKSKPLFIGHDQPRVPLNHNYYNLLDSHVMEWQAGLAGRAGIYGFCFYHYWFQGRMVLEKPAELLLADKKIDIHYCFSWANESWTKTWHGAGGNREVLIPQTYGGTEEWREHYSYFRRFFLDDRYMKDHGCPILVIYRLKNIPHFNDMIRCWNQCAKADGFGGIFIISMNVCREHVEKSKWVNASVDFEPNKTKYEKLDAGMGKRKPRNGTTLLWNRFAVNSMNYNKINRIMLRTPHNKSQLRGVFIGYDDSPRRNAGAFIIKGSSPRKFGKYLRRTLELSRKEQNEYVFVNAWNEWGEGNYLEPDTRYGYAYLNEIKKCKRYLEW